MKHFSDALLEDYDKIAESITIIKDKTARGDITVFTTYSSIDVFNYLLNTKNLSVRLVYDHLYGHVYAFGDGYEVMHPDLSLIVAAYYGSDWPYEEDEDFTEEIELLSMLYIPKDSEDHEVNTVRKTGGFAVALTTEYIYSFGKMLVSDENAYNKCKLSKLLAKESTTQVVINR